MRRQRRHEEDRLQIQCVRWFDLQYPKLRLLLFHAANGGRRSKAEAGIFKAMGVRAGFPDLVLLVKNRHYRFLAIEMKSPKGRQSETQKDYQTAFTAIGARYVVVRSFEQFMEEINGYLSDRD